MGYGLDEDWEEDVRRELTEQDKLIATSLEYSHEEWLQLSECERENHRQVYKLSVKA